MFDLTARYDVVNANAINDRDEIAGRTRDYRAVVLRDGTVDAFGPDDSTASRCSAVHMFLAARSTTPAG